ncbi:MAG: hypothetical protein ACRDR6_27390, partial [Pseudonocardiaceae bacterium]
DPHRLALTSPLTSGRVMGSVRDRSDNQATKNHKGVAQMRGTSLAVLQLRMKTQGIANLCCG